MIYLTLFFTFFKIGALTVGGGYAMLPFIQSEVLAHGWLTEQQIVNFVAVSESTPGPFAINIATYVGSVAENAGLLGSLCATLGVVLPSFLIILIVAKCYEAFKASKVVGGIMTGLRPAVVGLIASSVLSIGRSVLFPAEIAPAVFMMPAFWISLVLFGVMVVLAFKKVNPILLIVISAAVGVAAGYGLNLPV